MSARRESNLNRREFILATATPALPMAGDSAASPSALRAYHEQAMATCKARIRRLGEEYLASGRTDRALREQRIAEARTFAAHHRALSSLV